MSEPIVFISHFKVKEGKLDGLKQLHESVVEQIKTDKPGAMDRHTEGTGERAKTAFEFIEPTRREIYGMPSEKAMATMTLRPPNSPEVTFNHVPQPMGGYIRFKSE